MIAPPRRPPLPGGVLLALLCVTSISGWSPTTPSRRQLVQWLAPPLATTLLPPSAAFAAPSAPLLDELSGAAVASSWGQVWSKSEASVGPVQPLELPAWLAGTWNVSATLDQVSFPLGRRFLTNRVPGVRMASVLALPNIGSNPSFELRYLARGGGCVEDRVFNARSVLEGFWAQSNVTRVEEVGADRLKVSYVSPTRTRKDVEQRMELRTLFQEMEALSTRGGGDGDAACVWAQVLLQDNVEQRLQGTYKVIYRAERRPGSQSVSVRQTVASFLGPTDPDYLEARGKAVALFRYSLDLEPSQ